MATIIQEKHRGNNDRNQRWARLERADLFAQDSALPVQGVSQRQAAKALGVPRTTLQAWRAWPERLDACPQVVEFFASLPGLAFLHRLVLALHVVFVEGSALHVMLAKRFHVTVGQKRCPIEWRSTASYGHQRHVSTVRIFEV